MQVWACRCVGVQVCELHTDKRTGVWWGNMNNFFYPFVLSVVRERGRRGRERGRRKGEGKEEGRRGRRKVEGKGGSVGGEKMCISVGCEGRRGEKRGEGGRYTNPGIYCILISLSLSLSLSLLFLFLSFLSFPLFPSFFPLPLWFRRLGIYVSEYIYLFFFHFCQL